MSRKNAAEALKTPLKQAMAHWGMQIESSQDRLWAYRQVENAYLSTFQSLGALVSSWERWDFQASYYEMCSSAARNWRCFALLDTAGEFCPELCCPRILYVKLGLAAGTICALLAVTPALHIRGASFPFLTSALILLSVLVVGTATSILAVMIAFRSPLISSLRSE